MTATVSGLKQMLKVKGMNMEKLRNSHLSGKFNINVKTKADENWLLKNKFITHRA